MPTTISATRLDGRWVDKPDHDVVPRQAWLDRGLRFLSLMDTSTPRDIVTGMLPSAVPTHGGSGGVQATPWGFGQRITHGNGPLQYANHANYNITGPLTILTRIWIDSDGSDSFWSGIVKKRANGSSHQTDCPFAWGCYNYYNGGGQTIKFYQTRANAGGYREFNGPSEEHIGGRFKNFALINGGAIETAGTSIIDGVVGTLGGQGSSGSGTGAATGNSDVLHFGDDGVGSTNILIDWMAIFAAQLSAAEVEEIMAAPFGELVEPDVQRDYHDLWIPTRVNAGIVNNDVNYSGRRRGVARGVARGA